MGDQLIMSLYKKKRQKQIDNNKSTFKPSEVAMEKERQLENKISKVMKYYEVRAHQNDQMTQMRKAIKLVK